MNVISSSYGNDSVAMIQWAREIRRVISWAYAERGKYDNKQEQLFGQCSSGYCGF